MTEATVICEQLRMFETPTHFKVHLRDRTEQWSFNKMGLYPKSLEEAEELVKTWNSDSHGAWVQRYSL